MSAEAPPEPAGKKRGKRRRGASPTARTLAYLRRQGAVAGVVERRNPGAFITHDLFGFLDIVALRDGKIVGIQATAGGGDMGRRVRKIRDEPRHQTWLACGGLIEVWGWRKLKVKAKKGGAQLVRWRPRVIVVTVDSETEVSPHESKEDQHDGLPDGRAARSAPRRQRAHQGPDRGADPAGDRPRPRAAQERAARPDRPVRRQRRPIPPRDDTAAA